MRKTRNRKFGMRRIRSKTLTALKNKKTKYL